MHFFLCPLSLVRYYCGYEVNPFICNVRPGLLNIWGLEMNLLHYRKVRVTEGLHKNYTVIMSHNSYSYHAILGHTLVCDKTRRNSFSPNCCFNDQINSHSNQGQLDDNWMPSCNPCLRLSLTDGRPLTIHSQQQADCISFVVRSLSVLGSTA